MAAEGGIYQQNKFIICDSRHMYDVQFEQIYSIIIKENDLPWGTSYRGANR